jgi:ABC-type transport system involved in multi-copper enzyme maturation permease subunit
MTQKSFWAETDVLRAVLLREFRGALVNRYFQVFCGLGLAGGGAAAALSEAPNAAAFFILQLAIYFVSLFALLTGVSSARAENEEWPILFAQPLPRAISVLGKFVALWAIFAAVLGLLFFPALFSGAPAGPLGELYLNTLWLAAVFGSLGLCVGILGHDRVQALVLGLSAWVFLLFGVDLIALLSAQWAPLQREPDLWVAVLMFNPLDAFRIQALFAMEQIPAEAANKTPLAAWWITHASVWFASICAAWSAALLFFTTRRLARVEL